MLPHHAVIDSSAWLLNMRCTLLIPNLFWPRESAASVLAGLALPALSRLIARARSERFAALSFEGWLCQAFEVEQQRDWPVAPLTLALDGGEAGTDYWMRADPVHLRVDRDSVVLLENTLFDITASETALLVETLNAHFAADGLVFQALAPKRWYVRISQPPNLQTSMLSEVAGQDVRNHLPTGSDAGAWHRIFNEVQMLLHGHAVNDAREANGNPAVNSVWFWGGGTLPRVPGRHFGAVWSTDVLAQALATAASVRAASAPDRAAAWLDAARATGDAHHLIVLNELATSATYEDAATWRTGLEALEAHWFAPLLEALGSVVTSLSIVAIGPAACWRFEVKRGDLMRFWRRGDALTRYG
jgi:hypothetical protein